MGSLCPLPWQRNARGSSDLSAHSRFFNGKIFAAHIALYENTRSMKYLEKLTH